MIGLFFGETVFPNLILKRLNKLDVKYLIIDLTKKNLFKKNKNSYHVPIGQFGKILTLLKSNKCRKVIFAGKIDNPKLSKLKLDLKGIYYLPRIIKSSKKGDAAILKELIKILSENKIKVISSIHFNPEISLNKGIYSKIKPNMNDNSDIKKGIKILQKSNSLDHVQAVIVNNQMAVKETKMGTKKLIQSIKRNIYQKGVLIKFPKKNQDLRADLPTIGIDTFKDLKKKNLKGIVLKSKKNIILNKSECIRFIDKNKMFLVVK